MMQDIRETLRQINEKGLRFDEGPHTYTFNGEEIPSVTTIMEPLIKAEYSGISESVLEKAAERGTAIHNSIENHIKFEVDDIEPEYKGYFEAFLKWERQ